MPRRAARFYILSKRGMPIRADGSDLSIDEWDKRHKSRIDLSGALYFNRLKKAIKAAKKFGGKVASNDAVLSQYGQWHTGDSYSPLSRTSKRVSFLRNPRRRYRVRKNYKKYARRSKQLRRKSRRGKR